MEHKNIIDRFRESAVQYPDTWAIIDGEYKYSYEALDQASNRLANCLQQLGNEASELCFVFVKSEVAAIESILSVMKAGKIFVPISHDFPDSGINELIDDYQPAWIITDQQSTDRLGQILQKRNSNPFKVCLQDLSSIPAEFSFEKATFVSDQNILDHAYVPVTLQSEQPCYIYFTSGSTGKPKGVLGWYKGLNHFIDWEIDFLGLTQPKASQFSALTFDVFLRDIFVPLCSGGTICVPPRNNGILKVDELLQWIKRLEINLMHCVPTLFRELINSAEGNEDLPHLNYILLAGEKVFSEDVKSWCQTFGDTVQLVNIYGPSETTLAKFAYKIDYAKNQEGEVPLGKPISGSKAILLNEQLMPCRKGDVGEIYIRTPYRSLGYYKNEALTKTVFIQHAMIKDPNDLLYKTGDLAVVNADGDFEFRGRKDFQVKVKGIRVELSAIESGLRQHQEVEDAAVLYDEESKNLVAFIKTQRALTTSLLQDYLAESLPNYMIPLFYEFLATFPTNRNGKADRKKLLANWKEAVKLSQEEFTPASNEVEKVLVQIWKSLLDIDRVGIHHNFFQLGGHSLLATRVASATRKALQVEITVKHLFENPTIAKLAILIQKSDQGNTLPAITVQQRPEHIPLSFSQERLWFLDKLEGSTHYHIPSVLRFKGNLNREALKSAFAEIVNRHEVLRTTLQETDGKAWQQVLPKNQWQLLELNANGEKEESLYPIIQKTIKVPFDLSSDHLLRAQLIELAKDEFILALVMHHIASDGWSIGMLVSELVELYQANREKRLANLPELPIQYADYAIWQRAYLTGEVLEEKLQYWEQKLHEVLVLELPTDFKRPTIQSTKGETLYFELDQALSVDIQRVCQQEESSLFMTLLAAFKVMLAQYTGQDDICVGSPIANRTQVELEPLIGFFVNTLALRSDLSTNPSFKEFLKQVKATTLDAYAHQDVPFEKIVDRVAKQRDMSRTPLFQTMLVVQNNPASSLDLGEVELSPVENKNQTAKFDLTLNVNELPTGLSIGVEYCTDLFKAERINKMMQHFINLLRAIVADIHQPVFKLPMLTTAEQRHLLVDFNPTSSIVATESNLVELVEQQVNVNPQNTALVFENESISYEELNTRANLLAHHLIGNGAGTNQQVALCLDRSVEMVVGLLGILKSGAAYVPIDPDYPKDRIRYIIEDAQCKLLVSSAQHQHLFTAYAALQFIDIDKPELQQELSSNPNLRILPSDSAYVIYTSGTSGKPKGVLIGHQSVVNLIQAQTQNFGISEADTILQFSNYIFDASVEHIFLALANGAKLVVPTKENLLNQDQLESLIQKEEITHLDVTPSFLKTMKPKQYPKLKRVVVGGENCPPTLAKSWAQYLPFYNVYGPTETTVTSLSYRIGSSESETDQIPIGKPLLNTQVYVLNPSKQLVPIGTAGELYIGGIGLAKAYLNNEELTQEKFVDHPFEQGQKIYRTGDLVKWLPDGNLVFLGRIDDQVKIRGFRIELSEIEQVFLQAPEVKQAVVITCKDQNGNNKIAAYVLGTDQFDKSEVQAYLKSQLPNYMLPSSLMQVDEIPLTATGKVDKKALPDPLISTVHKQQYVAPRNAAEADLAEIWKELLAVEEVSIHDNFFELGGDSIITIQVVSRAKAKGYGLQARDLFQYQNIAELAEAIKDKQVTLDAEQGLLTGKLPLLPIQQEFLKQNLPHYNHYNQSVLLQIDKSFTIDDLAKVTETLLEQHDALRLIFKHENGQWHQEYGNRVGDLEVVDLRSVSLETLANEITSHCETYQSSLSIEEGEVCRFVWIQTPTEETNNRLFLVIHHLAVDGVSWRILLEQFESALQSLKKGEEGTLGSKTSSYRDWGKALEVYAQQPQVIDQLSYWKSVFNDWIPFPTELANEGSTMADVVTHTSSLTKALTSLLLQGSNEAYQTTIDDLLLSALGKVLSEYAKHSKLVIGLEGHGREELFEEIDTSSTMGWFTNLYPVLLEVEAHLGIAVLVPTIKEQLRQVPQKGIAFGLLKHLHPSEEIRNSLAECEADIVFNYLGQLDNSTQRSGTLQGAKEASGKNVDAHYPFNSKLEINAAISDGQLRLSWNYSAKHFQAESIQKLAEQYLDVLSQIIEHCQAQKVIQKTPVDYGLAPEVTYQELSGFLKEYENGKARSSQITSISRLSPMQEGMLFHSLFDTASEAYIEQMVIDLPEGLEVESMQNAWAYVLKNHDILRSKFIHQAFSIPVQGVYDEVFMPVELLDYSELKKEHQQEAIRNFLDHDRAKGFDFNEVPLMRITLIKTGTKAYQMVWTSHHILTDGWSIPMIMGELLVAYEAYASGMIPPEKAEDRYEEFIHHIYKQDQYKEREFWLQHMEGFENPTLLPFAGNSPDRNKGKGKSKESTLVIDSQLTEELKRYAQSNHVTMNTVTQGIWALLLSHYTRSKDVTFGVTVSGRPSDLKDAEQKVGLFINTIPIRIQFTSNQKVTNWLGELQKGHTLAREYQHTALTTIQRLIGVQGDLFDSLLVFENHPMGEVLAKDWLLKVGGIQSKEQTNYLLTLIVGLGKNLNIKFNYNDEMLEDAHIELIKGHFEALLKQIVSQAEAEVSSLKLLTAIEKQRFLVDYNATAVDYPQGKTLHQLVEDQVAKTPDHIALIYQDERISYRELLAKANRLANYLNRHGLPLNAPVPLVSHKSPEQIWGTLGVMKAGGHYIPIKGDLPKARINELLVQTEAQFVLVQEEYLDKVDCPKSVQIIPFHEPAFQEESAVHESVEVLETDLAYIIFTSGSTGKPKGVMIDHRGAVNTIFDMNARFGVTDQDRVFGVSELNFDLSVYDIFGTLACGATLVLPMESEIHDPMAWLPYVEREKVTIWDSVPQLMSLLVDHVEPHEAERIASLRICWMSGDWIPLNLPEKIWSLNPNLELISLGGATEGSIWSIHFPIKSVEPHWKSIPYGYPLGNQEMYILNDNLQACPVNIPGGIFIGGKGVAKGYHKDPEKTANSFIYHPEMKQTLYRTGDLGYYHPEGYIVFVGRLDTQVKVNGYRIELGEIETVLQQSSLVDQCVVIVKEGPNKVKRLVAYIVPNGVYQKDPLQHYLKDRLPEYMVPSIMMELEELPLTANGKVNKKALPEPDASVLVNQAFIAPRNELETLIANIWQHLLGIDSIGIHDNFFELGGHSLLATRVVSAIRKQAKVALPIRILFEKPSIASLATYLTSQNQVDEPLPSLTAMERPARIPLSYVQERLWFIDQLSGSVAYHIPAVFKLYGELDLVCLEKAFQTIVNRHEALRTRIQEEKGEAYQEVIPENRWQLGVTQGGSIATEQTAQMAWAEKVIQQPFDLSQDHMLRAQVLLCTANEHLLVLVMHHIAADGWSVSLFVDELVQLYEAFIKGEIPQLASLPIQYADYAIWQRKHLAGELLEQKLTYWETKLTDVEPLNLPTDFVRPTVQSSKGKAMGFELDATLSDQLKDLSSREGTTLFMTLLSAFNVLLHRYTGQEDICVGSPIANRTQLELETLIGMFVNTLALRNTIKQSDRFIDVLAQVKTTTLDAYSHQEVPFEKIIERIQPVRDRSRSPLFQVMFILQNNPEVPEIKLGDVSLLPMPFGDKTTKYDLTFHVNETPRGLHIGVEYCSDLFLPTTIERMMEHFQELLKSIVENPTKLISGLSMVASAEAHQLERLSKQSLSQNLDYQDVVTLFEAQVAVHSTELAVVFQDQQLTFQELNEQANQLADYLIGQGVKQGELVGIALPKSLEMMVGLWAILKSGAAYVPIDPNHPQARINYILEDTSINTLITSQAFRSLFSDKTISNLLLVDDGEFEWKSRTKANPKVDRSDENLAYVIYTSGSTGKPKGTLVSHGNLANYLSHAKVYLIESTGMGSFVHFSMTFDASITALFAPLIYGKSVVISAKESYEVFKDPNLINYAPYDFVKLTPAHLQLLKPELEKCNYSVTKRYVLGGEALQVSDFQFLIDQGINVELVNEYGPTEATVGCTTYTFNTLEAFRATSLGLSIGKPIANVALMVLDENGKQLPIGIAGELCVGGLQVTKGYLNQPELTAEKFIKHPFIADDGALLYKTGDLARWLPDGNLEFLGRIDEQVKIRGHRVELGEIELAVLASDQVKQAVVVARKSGEKYEQLVAYVIPKASFDENELRKQLKSTLPDYMVPSAIVELAHFPLTSNGKLDKKALPKPSTTARAHQQFQLPNNPIEAELVDIWKELLQLEKVGTLDDFFELGGHSLLATRVISAVRTRLEVELEIKDLFLHTTIQHLANYIQQLGRGELLPSISKQIRPAKAPLSFSQERLWFLDKLQGSSHYLMPIAFRLKGEIDKDALAYAFREIVSRHEVLRTVFREENGKVYQQVMPVANWAIRKGELKAENTATFIEKELNKPFDLSKDAMLRVYLMKLHQDNALPDQEPEYLLFLVMHHIASDGWSVSVLANELVELYTAKKQQRTTVLSELPIQYMDYALWQRNYLEGKVLDEMLDYWEQSLTGLEALKLPTDFARPSIQSTKGNTLSFKVSQDLKEQLQQLSHNQGATLFMTLLAAFKVLLYRYSGQEDICVGTPSANRVQQEIEPLIGFFVNTLALRSNLGKSETEKAMSFKELLAQVRANTLEAFAHQAVPFERIVDRIEPVRHLSHSPIFQVMFALQNNPENTAVNLEGASLQAESFDYNIAKFDLTLFVNEKEDGLSLDLEYCSELFLPSTIERMLQHYQQLLQSIVSNPAMGINQLQMTTAEETRMMLIDYNQTTIDYPTGKTLAGLFEEQVAKTPNQLALVYKDQRLTYAELNEKANRLANYLKQQGKPLGAPIPLISHKSAAQVWAVLGILKAGGHYIPIKGALPAARINELLVQTEANMVLVQADYTGKVDERESMHIIELKEETFANESDQHQHATVLETDLAYIIFTSGSTGKPKGVMIDHRGAVNTILDMNARFKVTASDKILGVSELNFDLSVYDIFGTLACGATLVLPMEKEIHSPLAWLDYIEQEKITIWDSVPQLMSLLVDHVNEQEKDRIASLRICWMSGDWIPLNLPEKIWKLNPSMELISLGGATEGSIWSIHYPIKQVNAEWQSIPYGYPLGNQEMYILNDALQPCPFNVLGGIYIGGKGVAKGYHKDAEKTANSFIYHPEMKQTLYRTGDLGYFHPEGYLVFAGRVDTQVKVNGYRIELGEIETILQQSSMVDQCVVVVHEGTNAVKRLVAYLVPTSEYNKKEIQAYLQSRLPEYMVPSLMMELAELPLTANGKVDKKNLPEPTADALVVREYIAPRNEQESALVQIWKTLLGLEQVSIHDNFFELGGHSMLAVKLMAIIHQEFAVQMPIASLFKWPTIASLALQLTQSPSKTDSVLIALNEQGNKAPLFFAPPAGGQVLIYQKLAKLLGDDQPFYAFQSHGLDGKTNPLASIEEMAAAYIEELLTIDDVGPFYLGGYSIGGKIAFEIALQLTAKGYEVAQLIIFDATAPESNPEEVVALLPSSHEEWLYSLTQEMETQDLRPLISQQELTGKSKNEQLRALHQKLMDRKDDITFEQLKGMSSVYINNATRVYRPDQKLKLNVPVVLFKAKETAQEQSDNPNQLLQFEDYGWQARTSAEVIVQLVDGNHRTLLNQQVEEVASKLKSILNKGLRISE